MEQRYEVREVLQSHACTHLAGLADGRRAISVRFDDSAAAPGNEIFPAALGWPNAKSYGAVEQGDHLLISRSQGVFVNGQPREPE
jgi:hypothetical protein